MLFLLDDLQIPLTVLINFLVLFMVAAVWHSLHNDEQESGADEMRTRAGILLYDDKLLPIFDVMI